MATVDLGTPHQQAQGALEALPRRISLTRTEYSLLELLMRRAGRVVSRDSLVEAVCGFDSEVRNNTLYAFMRLLRARSPERGGSVAALALTAFARLEDAIRARSSGYQGHLAKPISPEDLAPAIVQLQRQGGIDSPS